MFRAIVGTFIVCGTASATADVRRYDVHPTDGEFVKTLKSCGQKTRDELFERVIKFVPQLVLDARGVMTLITNGNEEVADEMVDGIGWWHYNGKQQTKSMVISLKPIDGKSTDKTISMGVVRRMDEIECSERWVGTVKEVPRGR